MSNRKRLTRLACVIAISVWLPVPTAASEGEEVQRLIDSLNTQYQKIEDYQVRITVSIKLPGFRMPRKRMTLSFKQPGRTHLKSRGFAMLPRRAILPSPDTLFSSLENLVIMPSAGGGRCHCVIVRGETVLDPGPVLVTEVTIDTARWVVLGISTSLEDAAVLDLQTEYLEVELGIFMPLKTSIKFELAEDFLTRGSRRRLRGVTAPADKDLSAMNDGDPDKMPRSGEAVLEFSRYRVNRGLKDSLFEK